MRTKKNKPESRCDSSAEPRNYELGAFLFWRLKKKEKLLKKKN